MTDETVYEITGTEAPDEQDAEAAKEAKDVKALADEYVAARKFDEPARKQYAKDRSYANGKAGATWASNANLIGAFIDILTSFLYARDPNVSSKAAKRVGKTKQDDVDFAETMGIIIPYLWRRGRLKKAARKMLRSSLSVGPGWLKVIMTHETRNDPKIESKLNDLEDNVRRLEAGEQRLKENGDEMSEDEIVAEKAELERLRESLRSRLEVVHNLGLAIDFVQGENMQVSLDVNDLTDHLDANWNADEQFVPIADLTTEFPRLTEKDVQKAEKYYQLAIQPNNENDESPDYTAKGSGRYTRNEPQTEDAVAFARVIELWDRRDNHIKTIVAGINRWAVPPFQPNYATSRFFPYFNLSLFETDGERHPQSLSGRLLKLQEEYSSKRSNSRLVTERSIPGIIFDKTGLSANDARAIESSVAQELVGINPTKGDDIRKLFAEKPVAKVDPLIFSTSPVLSDMERVAGVQEALSQSVTTAKTATEAKIEQAGFTSRTSADRDTLEDMLQDLAQYTAELAIQAIKPEMAVRIAGEAALWPHGMEVEDLIMLTEIEIEAGSTGKPDDESLRQSWSVLLPLVQNAMVQIQNAQLTGNIPLANAIRNLIEETMRRLDERIDVEQFIPQGELPSLLGQELPVGDPNQTPKPGDGRTPEQQAADGNTLT
tara:strand:+ start:8270 stop:10249 length:1980 start_codon:yes stop_codon:yes gene_type:complete